MPKLRAVVDTNVAVSGLLFGGVPGKIVKSALKSEFDWVSSKPLLVELERVLRSRKFSLSEREIESFLVPVLEVIEIVVPRIEVSVIERCPADNRVLEAAIEGRADVITTGDRRDLVSLVKFRGIPILSPREFLDLL